MKTLLTLPRSSREIRAVLIFALSMAIPVAGIAQISVTGIAPTAATEIDSAPVTEIVPTPVTEIAPTPVTGTAQTSVTGNAPLDWQAKLHFHAEATYGPWAVASFAAYAGLLQEINSPKEWGQGGDAYGKRFASTVGWSATHGALAPVGTCDPGNDPHADRRRRRDTVHLAYRQFLRRGLSFRPVVSGPSQYLPPRICRWLPRTRVGNGRQSRSGVLAGYQKQTIPPEVRWGP